MYNKKKIATLLVIGMAAMFMMNGCQKKASETETTKQTTAQSESTAQTEAATTYTSESNSFSFDLPDSAWVATKEGIENKWAFMKEGVGTIRITHKKSKIKEKNLPQSQEDAIALLNDIQENAFSQVEYKKDSTNGTELYYYAASTQDADLGYVYLIKYLINTDTESYTITAKLTSSDSTVQQAVKSAVTSFKVLMMTVKRQILVQTPDLRQTAVHLRIMPVTVLIRKIQVILLQTILPVKVQAILPVHRPMRNTAISLMQTEIRSTLIRLRTAAGVMITELLIFSWKTA